MANYRSIIMSFHSKTHVKKFRRLLGSRNMREAVKYFYGITWRSGEYESIAMELRWCSCDPFQAFVKKAYFKSCSLLKLEPLITEGGAY